MVVTCLAASPGCPFPSRHRPKADSALVVPGVGPIQPAKAIPEIHLTAPLAGAFNHHRPLSNSSSPGRKNIGFPTSLLSPETRGARRRLIQPNSQTHDVPSPKPGEVFYHRSI